MNLVVAHSTTDNFHGYCAQSANINALQAREACWEKGAMLIAQPFKR